MSTPPIESGSITVFRQTTAPVGWTKLTSYNDYAIRVVSGTASFGGSYSFSSTYVDRPGAGTVGTFSGSIGSGSSVVASHTHPSGTLTTGPATLVAPVGISNPVTRTIAISPETSVSYTTATAGSSVPHGHPVSFGTTTYTGNPINFSINYVDIIIAQRD